MHRFYLPGEITGDSITIADDGQLHKIRDVLRLSAGDEIAVFDGRGNEYACVIAELRKNRAELTVKDKRRAAHDRIKIAVACAMPKKSGMDDIVDSLTQLGADVIIPMLTERVIVRLDAAKQEARLGRWREISRSAAEQSGRPNLPVIAPVTDFADVVAQSGSFDLRLIPALTGERRPIADVLADAQPRGILALIGPEGDFTPEEVARACRAGFIPVSLGESVLRVAVAAAAVASFIRLSLGS